MEHIQCKVSVIIVIYNPIWEKFYKTIMSILKQINIEVEIIICDDGSQEDYFDQVHEVMHNNAFDNYTLIKNRENLGTVKNLYQGLKITKGEYIYCISPGDYLYSKDTLYRLYSFAIQKNAQIVFGDAVYYHMREHNVMLSKKKNALPFNVEIFNEKDITKPYISFMLCGNFILGASFFRRRDVALKYIEKVVDVCKYMEDTSSTAYALAEGVQHYHFNQNIVWYEDDTGISNSKSKKWEELLDKDLKAGYRLVLNDFKSNKNIYNIAYIKFLDKKINKLIYLIKNDIRAVCLWIYLSIYKKMKARKIHQHEIDDTMIRYLYDGNGVEQCK